MDTRTGKLYDSKEIARLFGVPERSLKPAPYVTPGQLRRMKVGRNEPCPCGSGKKFKKCCYAPVTP